MIACSQTLEKLPDGSLLSKLPNILRADFSGGGGVDPSLLNYLSNPNLLINWDFRNPVNQKGLREYDANSYCIDGWKANNLKIIPGTVRLTGTGAYSHYFSQILPPETVSELKGETVTLSLLEENDTGYNPVLAVQIVEGGKSTYLGADNYNKGLHFGTVTIPDTDIEKIIFYCNASGTGTDDIIGAKLEQGPYQTLAHQDAAGNWVMNDPQPDKSLELLKCQRYQMVYKNADCIGFSTENIIYIYKPCMRADPVVVQNEAVLALASGEIAVNALTIINSKQSGAFVVATSKTVNFGTGPVYVKHDSPAYLILDANL